MPDADRLSGGGAAPIDAAVIREAARWLVRLHGDDAGANAAACRRWRAADPAHEQAWRKAERLAERFGAVPPALGVPVLMRPASAHRRALVRTLAVLAVAPPAAWLGWRLAPWQGWVANYATATGQRREIALADGSRLILNTATAVDVAFDATQRLLRLRQGEVHIQTAADARAFIVETPQGRLRALGTRFVVRLREGGAEGSDADGDDGAATTELTVLEHRVEITPRGGAAPRTVAAGQAVRFSAARIGPLLTLPAEAAGGAPGWTHGVLYADGMRLDDFLAELSRYRPGVIRCAPAVAALRISGAFQLADTEYVLTLVQETLPVDVLLRTRWWVTVVARGSAGA